MKPGDSHDSEPKAPSFKPVLSHSDDDHVEHVDERWLVSYADMMTLLFGLFVMLYSMSTNFEEVQKSMTKQFSQNDSTPEKAPTSDPKELETLKAKLDLMNLKMMDMTKDNEQLKLSVIELDKMKTENETLKESLVQAEKLKVDLASTKDSATAVQAKIAELTIAKQKLEKQLKEKPKSQISQTDFEKIKSENSALKAKVEEAVALQEQIDKLTTMNDSLNQKLSEMPREPASLAPQVQDLQQTISDLKISKEKLEKQLKETQDTMSSMSPPTPFAAVVITWPTADHDIDLIVTDPEGKTFNFKERNFAGHPGQFVLDSRRGPGAEMWQTDRTLAGTYTLKYVFYNTYGNSEPAPVFGTVYSSRGMFELPKVKLNFENKREQIFRISISKKGEVSLLK